MPTIDEYPERKKHRLRGYHYDMMANYFVTIVTNERKHLFGSIDGDSMMLSDAGKMIEHCILQLPLEYADCEIVRYVVMPNHVHILIHLPEGLCLYEVVRKFKAVTTRAYMEGVMQSAWQPFHLKLWQRSYYDHIIRNHADYSRVETYIINNPQRWVWDRLNKYSNPEDLDEW